MSDTLGSNDEDVVLVGHADISDYNPAYVLPEPPEEIKKIRSWLEPTDYAHASGEYHKHLTSHMHGTGSWLTSSATYKQWLSEPNYATLWIKGIPGSGKSVVAAHLIDLLSKSHPGQPVLYFFFRQIIDANHEPRALLRDWLDQILDHSPPLQKDLKGLIDDNRSIQSLSMEDLWSYLRLAVQNLSGRTFCVADALDEMDQGNDEFLHSLVDFGNRLRGKAKIIITSRPTVLIESSLRTRNVLRLRLEEDMVDSDIASYVDSGLQSSHISKVDQVLIRKAIPGHANGIFLYAKLAMDAFLEPGADPNVVVEALPIDLHAMYTKLLHQHAVRSGVPRDVQLLILQWVTHATRPLRLLELAEIVAHLGTLESSERMDITTAKDLVRVAAGPLLEILPNETVCVIHHSFTEYLKHTDRFENNNGYPVLLLGATHGRLALACIRYLQAGCLDSMITALNGDGDSFNGSDDSTNESDDFESSALHDRKRKLSCHGRRTSVVNEDPRVKLQYPFYAYAAAYWQFHVRKSCSAKFPQEDINTALEQLFTNTTHKTAWLNFHWTKSGNGRKGVTPLHIAARFGLTQFAEHLQMKPSNVDEVDGFGKTPLWWAATSGHADMISLLLRSGAQPDVDEKVRGLKPLHEAASKNHADAVRVLLQAGVDPLTPKTREDPGRRCGNAPRTQGHTPLMYACKHGHLEALEAFLPFITDSDIAHRALAWSAESGRSKLVQCLLHHHGVDANTKVRGDTILYRACKRKDRDSILTLLEAGAEPMNLSLGGSDEFAGMSLLRRVANTRNGETRGHTALHALCGVHRFGFNAADHVDATVLEEIFEALLSKGVSVDFRTPSGRTALHSAVNNPTLTKLLLQAGANANAVDDDGCTPLHNANSPETIALLLEVGRANIDSLVPSDGRSALLKMLHGRSRDGVLKLLEYRPDMSIRDSSGKGPLHIALSSYGAQVSLVKMLLEAGADPDERDHAGITPMLALHLDGREAMAIIDILLGFGANINAQDRSGASVLTRAVRHQSYRDTDNHSTINNLIVRGADLHIRDYKGRSLLHHAVGTHDLSAFEASRRQGSARLDYLLSLDMDVRSADYRGNTLLHELALRSDALDSHRGPGSVDLWKQLQQLGLDIDKGNNLGRTALHILSAARFCRDGSRTLASKDGSFGPLDFVLTNCKDINQCDIDGLTALHLASTVSESTTMKLLDAGADPHRKTNDGLTALHLAARSRQSNVVGLLIDSCKTKDPTCIDARDAKGNSPLYYACRSGVPETVRLLIDAGADTKNKALWFACAEFDEEQKLWSNDRHLADAEIHGDAGGLTIDDKTRPGCSPLGRSRGNDKYEDTTRLEEITEMLAESGCDRKGLVGDEFQSNGAIHQACDSGSNYTRECLIRARDISSGLEKYRSSTSVAFTEQVIAAQRAAVKTAVAEWSRKYGKSDAPWFLEHLLKSREYDGVSSLLEESSKHVDGEIVQLELLVRHGYSALLDKIGTMEAQRRLGQGHWHAFGDKSKPGLYNGSEPDTTSRRPLMSKTTFLLLIAVERGVPNMDVIRLLVEKFQVDVNEYCFGAAENGKGVTPQHTALHEIAHGQHWWQVALAMPYLISKGAEVNAKDHMGRTPLHIALGGRNGDFGVFHKHAARALLASGANVQERDNRGVSCLASTAGDLEMVKLLLSYNAKITADAVFMSLHSQRNDVLHAFLEAGADPNVRLGSSLGSNLTSRRPISVNPDRDVQLAEEYPLYHVAVSQGANSYSKSKMEKQKQWSAAAVLMQTLLSAGADPFATFRRLTPNGTEEENDEDDEDDSVKELLRDGRVAKITVEEVLLAHDLIGQDKMVHPILVVDRLDADRRDAQGRSLLHMAGHHYNLDAPVDSLFAAIDPEYISSLPSFLDCLCGHGADPLATDASGNNILHHMFLGNKRRKDDEKDRSSVAHLASLYPGLVDQVNSQGKTPLLMALKHATLHGMTGAAEALLQAGASVLPVDNNGNSGLHILAFSLYKSAKVRDLFLKLLERGSNVNARNKRGETPLFNLNKYVSSSAGVRAEHIGAAEALSIFERAEADLFVRDHSGKTLLHVAAKETQESSKNSRLERLWRLDPDSKPLELSIIRFKTLLSRGLDPFAEDEGKRTPLDVAAAYGKASILALFEKEDSKVLPVLTRVDSDDDSDRSDW